MFLSVFSVFSVFSIFNVCFVERAWKVRGKCVVSAWKEHGKSVVSGTGVYRAWKEPGKALRNAISTFFRRVFHALSMFFHALSTL